MVQVPTTSGGSSAARASPASAATSSNAASTRAKGAANGHGGGGGVAPAPVHLSAMKSAPLDLSSVERRGQPTASRETTKKMRPHGLQEAPTYRPTMEEFKDPFVYMKKIAPEASQYGICKIIPPVDWNPGFAIDTEKFHFKTRKQELNSIEGSTRANLTYLDQLAKFHKQHGTSLTRFPSVDKRPLDLYKLKKAVESRGGFEKVCKLKKWAEIGRDLGYSGKIMSSLSTSLKNSYQRWLFPYEEYLRHAKPGVQAQLEYEYGGPITPSPATSPMKKSHSHQHTPSSLRDESPAVSASEALNSSLRNGHTNGTDMKEVPMLDPPAISTPAPAPQPQTSGFTPVNAGGFTAVNAGQGGFTPVNVNNHARREREPERSFTPPRRVVDSPMSSAKNTPEYRPSNLKSTPLTNGFTSNPLKRQMSHDSLDSRKENGTPRDDSDGGANGRRSKRLKKEAVPTVAGSHMSFLRPLTPRIPGEPGSFAPGEKCEHCAKGEDAGTLLVCESCDHGYHMQCLDPPLTQKPDYDWNCPRCLVGDGQFGFEEGSIYSLKQFHDKAADFKEGYFQNRLPFDPVLNCPRPVTEDDIEREFWRLVASLEETVEVEYGADIHSTTHGSGFPTIERNPRDPYSTDPWNLNITPLHPDSLFRHIKSDISGMTVPWLYVGMIFSTFCWHNEDHYAYSANYQHFGSTKTWYGIPGEDAEKFENAMREAVPELFETQPDLLFQLVTLLTPEQLKKAGVRCYALDQRAGQFVITFPQAYHAGFNHGFNFNEAVNFAPKDWEPFGEFGVERLQQFRRQPCFSHDELLWTAAEGHATGGVTIETAKWLAPALERMRGREVELRKNFLAKHNDNGHPCVITDEIEGAGPRCHVKFEVDDRDVPEEEYQCSYCKAYAYLSRYNCDKSGKVLCLLHAGNYECCDMSEEERYKGKNHTLHYRRTEEAISSIYQKVCDKAHLPEVWEDKVTKTLEEDATPSLKVLRALLNEGERIPYELPSLPTLKAFVDRCNEWVEEATNYIVRKQQNRRKSEKSWRKGSKAAEAEERERELRKVENVVKLLKDADGLGFDCPEIIQLRERADAITSFQRDAKMALDNQNVRDTQVFEELLERGRGLNVDMPETERLEGVVQKNKWDDRAKEARGQFLSLTDIKELIAAAEKLDIKPASNSYLRHFKEQKETGEGWEMKAKELMAADSIHYPQLEALSNQAQAAAIPVSAETLAEVDRILNKQREAHRQIVSLYERSKEADIAKRPTYSEVVFTVDSLLDLNSKPSGTLDLEKEQKRHEDWMRKGKKLFGKANAPLHILKSHMEYVLERNLDCFDIMYDKPRMPAEPASREPSPVDGKMHTWEDPRFREVFCICRKVEAGMMIECELCHEWYHGKCLKIARGKVKEDEKYTCPICDWRVKIPRDAARPKLEDLIEWQNEIKSLPFQPDEEDLLARIIDNAQDFRNHVAPFCNPIMATSEESSILRFYLRKIEGAEILLVRETNYFRAQLHTWSPVAPDPPPVLETSKSTRKPRPTKLQKLMAQHGVDDPENLPQALRTKQHGFKRKSSEPQSAPRPAALQPAPGGPGGPGGGVPHYAMGGQQQQFSPHQQGGQGNGVYPGGPSPGGGARGGQMLADPQQLHQQQQQQPRFAYDDMPYASRERQGFAPMAFVHAPPYGSGQGSSGSGSGSGTGAPGPFTGAAMGRGGEMTLDGRGLGSPLGEGFEGSLIGGGGGVGGLSGGSGGGGVGGLPGGGVGGAGREGGMERLFKDLTNADEEAGKGGKEEVGGGEAGELLRDMTMFGEEWGGDE